MSKPTSLDEKTLIRLAQWVGEDAVIKRLQQHPHPWVRMLGEAFRSRPYPSGATRQDKIIPGGSSRLHDPLLLGQAFIQLVLEASDLHAQVNHPEDIEMVEVWREGGVGANKLHLKLAYPGFDDEVVEVTRHQEGWDQDRIETSAYLDAWNPEFASRWKPL